MGASLRPTRAGTRTKYCACHASEKVPEVLHLLHEKSVWPSKSAESLAPATPKKKGRRDQKSDTARRWERTSTRELSKPSFRARLPSEGNVFLHRNGQQNGWTRGHEPWINPALTIAAITVRIPYVVRTHFLRKEVFSCARDSLDDSYGAPKSYSNVNHNPSFD